MNQLVASRSRVEGKPYLPVLPICTGIVNGALFAAWWMTGWYGAGMVFLGWLLLSLIAATVLAMVRDDAARLAEQTESLYTCSGTCGQSYRYGTERWIEHVPYCASCATTEMERLFGGNEAA